MLNRLLGKRMQDLSIRYKLQFAILSTSTAAILLAGLAIAGLQWKSASDTLNQDLKTLAQVMAANTVAAVSFYDVASAEQTLSALQARPNVTLACLFSRVDGILEPFAEYRAAADAPACNAELLARATSRHEFVGRASVQFQSDNLGELLILENDAKLWAALRSHTLALAIILLACLLVAFLLSGVVQSLISEPIMNLARTVARISRTQDFSIRAEPAGRDEIGDLIQASNAMLEQIESGERRLRELNEDLEAQVLERNQANQRLRETLEQLREAQHQLVQTEKMAALGGLVAGVAHEINTPVGIGVTAASTLESHVRDIQRQLAAETLTANGLNRFLDVAKQSGDIILTNLERAANLIQSFKQVAVDQSSQEHRLFQVHEYIEEILLSLKPKLKHTQIQIELQCPDDLKIDSYPGVLSQILTNLMMNALTHAYAPDDKGLIQIRVEATDTGGLRMEFADDGRGIPQENLDRIFEPFFTTRRGQGGSGLGLHIVYNLVTQQLQGQIQVRSALNQGTVFNIEFESLSYANSYAQAG